MRIIETTKEWNKFMTEFKNNDSVVIPIQCDPNVHPIQTELCLLYVRFLDGNTEEYILPFRHSDAVNLGNKYIKKTHTPKKVYTYDKKKLLHFLDWKNVYDVQMNYYLEKNVPLVIDEVTTNAHRYFYSTHYKTPNINCAVPLVKHIEYCRKLVDEKIKLAAIMGNKLTESVFETYNFDVLESLQKIESNGLKIIGEQNLEPAIIGSFLLTFGINKSICKIFSLIFYPFQLLISKIFLSSEAILIIVKKK